MTWLPYLAFPALPPFMEMLKGYLLVTSLTGGALCAYKARITHPSPSMLDNPTYKKVAETASGFVVGGVLFPFIPVALVALLVIGTFSPRIDESVEMDCEPAGWSFDISIGRD